MGPKRLEKKDAREVLDTYDAILLDCDGVIWNGNTLYDGIKEALEFLHEKQIKHFFLTNNATASRAHYCEKFHALGLTHVTPKQIYTSGSAAAHYLKTDLLPTLPEDRRQIYVIGQAGLEDELRDVGLTWSGGTTAEDNVFMPAQDFSSITPNPNIGVVLQGFDMHINYKKATQKAYNYLSQNRGCRLVLTNADKDVFTETATCPGEGALASVLTGIVKPIICGKPEPVLLDVVVKDHNLDRKRLLMVGDRLETDILFGRKGKIDTLLVLTGSSTVEDLKKTPAHEQPTYVGDSLAIFSP